jgi:hypothetical protein
MAQTSQLDWPIEEARRLREAGHTYQQIADKFGVTRQAVHSALTRKRKMKPPMTPLGNVRLDPPTAKMLDDLLPEFDGNRSELIRQAIRTLWLQKHPAAILGYVRIDRRGDIDADATCPECGQDLTEPFLCFREGGGFGVLCSGCATSE